MTKDMMDTTTWTDRDRRFLDTVRKLDDEQKDFLLLIMDRAIMSETYANFIEKNAGKYRLNTGEGRAAFLAAMDAI